MNTYYQTNPFQQNVDILKGFFKRPIVLVTAILMGVSSLLSIVAGAVDDNAANIATKYLNSLPLEIRQHVGNQSSSFSLPVLPILVTVAFFLFYFFSKSNSKNLKVPATMFKVVSIIELVSVCVVIGVLLINILLCFKYTPTFLVYFSYIYSDSSSYVYGILIAILIGFSIVGAFLIWYCALKVKFACSIKKSTKSINLFKNGAKGFGVFTIIVNGIVGITVFASLPEPGMGFAVFAGLVNVVGNILFGVTAIQYANYINEISVNFTTQPPYVAANSEPYNPQATVQPPYGTPYTPPTQPVYEPYQPQPVAPVEQAPEVNAYEPVEEPIAEDVAPTEEAPAVETNSFCSACGNPVKADDYFCNNCGNKLK